MDQQKKVAWSDKSHSLLHHVDAQELIGHLGKKMAPGWMIKRGQAGDGCVVVWAMHGPAIHRDVTWTCTLCPNIVANHVHVLIETVFYNSSGL